VTIATNMAGRGTDIVLGGNLEMRLAEELDESKHAAIEKEWEQDHQAVLDAGGLYVIGTERHESRRIDNQLRGRSGRQGDPGETRFYLSMDDTLMRIFGSEKISNMMQRVGMEEGEAIESRLVSRVIENAQRKVEGHNFDIRKQLLEYDDVANEQRKLVYSERNELMSTDDVSENVEVMREEVVNEIIDRSIPVQSLPEQWDVESLEDDLRLEFAIDLPVAEKAIMLQTLDTQWKEHLSEMDYLRQGIGLRGYAQKNPKQEYKREAFEMFTTMLDRVKTEVVTVLSKFQIREESDVDEIERRQREAAEKEMEFNHAQSGALNQPQETQDQNQGTFVREQPKVGRNSPCPCGSGKKYKQCHGKIG